MPRFVHFLYLIPLSLGAVISLRAFRYSWPRAYRFFSLFLIGTLASELFAISWKLYLHDTKWWHYSKSNIWIYNVYYILECVFYFGFYYAVLGGETVRKKTVLWISSLFLAGASYNLFFLQGIYQLGTYTIIAGNVGVLGFTLLYFRQELRKPVVSRPAKDPLFWISVSAFLFNAVSLPYFIFINYLSRTNLTLAIALFNIVLWLNIIMYTLFVIAFTCKRPFPKKHI
jgi:hypothetical protein